jgi:hypothetical protein
MVGNRTVKGSIQPHNDNTAAIHILGVRCLLHTHNS